MNQGDIVLAGIPQSDGEVKNRPIVLLKKLPKFEDFLVCGLSTQLHQEIKDFDEIIEPTPQNRLRQTSLIRLSFLAVVTQEQIRGVLGKISETTHRTLIERLTNYLLKS